jgi:hypothetical protein
MQYPLLGMRSSADYTPIIGFKIHIAVTLTSKITERSVERRIYISPPVRSSQVWKSLMLDIFQT